MDESKPVTASTPPTGAAVETAVTTRAQRLAAALRDNLKRRKASGRAGQTDKPRN